MSQNLVWCTDVDRASAALPEQLSDAARAAMDAGVPDSTKRAYSGDWQRFTTWCSETGRRPLPASPETLVEYTAYLTTAPRPDTGRPYAPSSIERALAAVRTAHRAANVVPPETKGARLVLRGYADRRARSNDPADRTRKATAALPKTLRAMLAELDRDTLIGKRDAALLLLGFATAARASELAAVDITDVTPVDSGLLVHMYRGKVRTLTEVAVPFGQKPSTCPVRAVRALREALAEAGRSSGPLFVRVDRHGRIAPPMLRAGKPIGDPSGRITAQAAAQVVERAAEDAELSGDWSGHSLRRGFATAARQAGHDLVTIGRHGGWKDGSKALLGYFEDVDKWEDNPLSGTGL